MPSILRHTILHPTSGNGSTAAVQAPGIEQYGTGIVARAGVANYNNSDVNAAPADSWRHVINPNARNHGEPLVGIGISPDSALHSALINIPGDDFTGHVVVPGSPLVIPAGAEVNTIYASARCNIPVIFPATPNDDGTTAWDASLGTITGNALGSWGWPLRLELYYGAIPMRSPYRSPLVSSISVLAPANGHLFAALIPVDGRRTIDLAVIGTTPGVNLISVNAIRGCRLGAAGGNNNIVTQPLVTSVALVAQQYYRLRAGVFAAAAGGTSLQVTPFPLLQVQILGGVTPGNFDVQCTAYDEADGS